MKKVWEILVPTVRNDGRPFRLRFHKVWDQHVRSISGGMSIVSPVKGQWIDPEAGDLYEERMIPVRFVATDEEARELALHTKTYYEQKAIMYYCISTEVNFV